MKILEHLQVVRKKIILAVTGGLLASAGLELFLHPHQMIAGGVTGLSGLISHHTEAQFGVVLLMLNLPLLLWYFRYSRHLLLYVLPGMLAFSGMALLLSPVPALSGHPLASALAGGALLGWGAGLMARCGGLLDSLSGGLFRFSISRRLLRTDQGRSDSPWLIAAYLLPLTLTGWLTGWSQSLYSAIGCLAAYEAASIVFNGWTRPVCVITHHAEQVAAAVHQRLRSEPSEKKAHESQPDKQLLLYQIHVWELSRFKSIVQNMDPLAEWVEVEHMPERY
ncbi:YitT family protein [Paenibacillus sp. JX-17]|uniref:YitT family protein n=1 Tax=Paenibacillus lacisoli TaxID=3064525 RepID=A0ABT9CI76_9BACL|nr:YitT family protein [Paenibacillus sp. JX-17]MDO7907376.1 YitT family protein [Paenibacillus sp. JX-17]